MNVMLAAESKSLAELVERLNRQDQLSADQTAESVLSAPTATFAQLRQTLEFYSECRRSQTVTLIELKLLQTLITVLK
jgi:hypothetical protein